MGILDNKVSQTFGFLYLGWILSKTFMRLETGLNYIFIEKRTFFWLMWVLEEVNLGGFEWSFIIFGFFEGDFLESLGA